MPTPRNRAPRPYPGRRPRVAGLKRPNTPEDTSHQDTAADPVDEQAVDQDTAEDTDRDAGTDEPDDDRDEPERIAGDTASATRTAKVPTIPAPDGTTENTATDDTATDDTATDDTATDDTATEDPATEDPATERDVVSTGERTEVVGAQNRTLRVAVGLLVLAVLLGALATFFAISASNAASAENTALTDAKTTRTVAQQVGNDLNTVMSFNYKDPGRTTKAARDLFADPKLAEDYSQVMNVLQDKGAGLRLSVDTEVVTSGVERLEGDNAVLLALATQTYTKGENAQRGQAVAVFRVNAVNDDGRWRISKLEQY